MYKYSRITISAILILLLFSNFLVFSDTSLPVFEAKNILEFENILTNEINSRKDSISIKYYGSVHDIKSILSNIINKNAYIKSTLKEIKYSYSEYSDYISLVFHPEYIISDDKEKLAKDKIKEILSEIITTDMYTHEKVKAVNDYIVLNGKYDTSLTNYSHYDLLFKGTSVCNGYALLTYSMLMELNIPVLLVPGVASNGKKSESHIWNLVNVGGYWFNLDVTWNDPIPDKEDSVSHAYFLITDEEISITHKADSKIIYPKSTISYEDYLTELSNIKDMLIPTPTTDGINIKIRDSYIDFKKYDDDPVEPFIEKGRTLVPLRAVFETLGYEVDWNGSTNAATVTDGSKTLKIRPNDLYASINGLEKSLDVPSKLVNGRIMVPVRFISEAFGNTVLWDSEEQTVYIY